MKYESIFIREIGDAEKPFEYAGTDDNGQVTLDAWDHGVGCSFVASALTVSHIKTGGEKTVYIKAQEIALSVYVTDSRVIFYCSNYDKGGGWIGGGVQSLVLNAISKAAARARTKGTVLVGHIRYEWLQSIGYFCKTGWLSQEQMRFIYNDSDETQWIIDLVLNKRDDSSAFAHDVLHRACKYRLVMKDEISDIERLFLESHSRTARIPVTDDPRHKFSIAHFPTHYKAPTAEFRRPPLDKSI